MNLDIYERRLSERLQYTIRRLGAVDTGNMMRNSFITLNYDKELEIDIDSVDYYIYVDPLYNITNIFLEDSEVISIIEDCIIFISEETIYK